MKFLSFNPEIQRNAWIELSVVKLILLPCIFILVLFLYISYYAKIDTSAYLSYSKLLSNSVFFVGLGFLSTVGLFKASTAVTDEANIGTWVLQRLTPVHPWTMAFGKLFGPSILGWYGGLVGFLLLTLIAVINGFSKSEINHLLWIYLLGMIGSMGIQAFVIFLTLFRLNRVDIGLKIRSNRFRALGFLGLILFSNIIFSILSEVNATDETQPMSWYGISFQPLPINTIVILYFTAWAVFALRKAMGTVLREHNSIYPIIYFLACSSFIIFGFSIGSKSAQSLEGGIFESFEYISSILIIVVLLFALLLEDKTVSIIHNIVLRFKQNPKKWAYILPSWIVIFIVGIGLIVLEFIASKIIAYTLPKEIVDHVYIASMSTENPGVLYFTLVIIINLVSIFLFFGIMSKPRLAETYAIVYGILHSIIVVNIGISFAQVFEYSNFFYSTGTATLIESAILLTIAFIKYKKAISFKTYK
jgi:hypothetical protein